MPWHEMNIYVELVQGCAKYICLFACVFVCLFFFYIMYAYYRVLYNHNRMYVC